ncbi:MAG: response regulator [bacterium]|nr:response regulator [bacterium]
MTEEKKKILIVDDSLTMRKVIQREFESGNFDTKEAANGIEALKAIEDGFIPDLITLDLDMPKMNGFDTCGKIYSAEYAKYFPSIEDNKVPVIFVTSSDNLKDRKRGFYLGATDFVTKPFENGDILKLVNKTLNPDNRLQGITALLVDDSKSARLVVSKGLSNEGIAVIEAEDGAKAFEIMCNKMSQIDIVVTDIEMPIMNGVELCEKIRKELGLVDIPIIFFTGIADRSKIFDVFQVGGTDYLTKPFMKEEMIARILVQVEKTQLNKRLRKSLAELRENMQIKNDMIAVLSHDMRTPINGIVGFSNLLMQKEDISSEDKENIILIKESGKMLLTLINDILDLSKIKSEKDKMEMKPISVFEIVEKSVKALNNLAELKEQEIALENKCSSSIILGNSDAFMRVTNNLLANSIKFTPNNGLIRIVVKPGATGFITILVIDTGIGIPAKKLPFLFDKFSRVSQKGTAGEEGTGLGMSIVKEIVEAHGGKIQVTSKLGEGSTFKISIPKPDSVQLHSFEENKESPENKNDSILARIKGMKILLAEDNPVNQKIAKIILTKSGCQVKVANNGQKAVDMYTQNPDDFSVVFMDMEMPELNGLEATHAIRQQGFEDVPIIAMTASTRDIDRKKCVQAGMNGFITKPISQDAILKAMEKWV